MCATDISDFDGGFSLDTAYSTASPCACGGSFVLAADEFDKEDDRVICLSCGRTPSESTPLIGERIG